MLDRQNLISVYIASITVIMALLFTAETSCAATDRPPNIVLIMADDIGVEGIGCYGGLSYTTPNLDRLATAGLKFNHAYSQPLCANTRLQLMTGLHNDRNWICFGILDPKSKTIGHYMHEAGYKSCIAGKWQLQSYDPPGYPGSETRRGIGMHPKDAGFDNYSLFHSLHTEDKGSRYADPTWLEDGKLKTEPGKYGPDMWVDYINAFMEREQDNPFFVYYPMALPHWPMTPTPDSKSWADPAQRGIADTKNFKDMVEYMDKCVGKIVKQIDDLGLRENTIIIFYSDNGTHLEITSQTISGPVTGGKALPTNAGTHVPLIVNWPRKFRTGTSEALIDSTDFIPTLMEAVGKPLPAENKLDGISFYQKLTGDDASGPTRESIYSFYDPRPGWDKDRFTCHVSARDRQWKLYETGQLFDIKNDVLEKNATLPANDSPQMATVRERLAAVIESNSQSKNDILVNDSYLTAEHPTRKPTRGDWKIEDGTASVAQDDELFKKYNNHGPIMIYEVEHTNAKAVVEFRPTDCKTVVFTMDAAEGGHAFRVKLRTRPGESKNQNAGPPSTIVTYGPRPEEGKPEMIELSKTVPKLLNDEWNRIEVTVVGNQATVVVNGEEVSVQHERIAQKKKIAKLGFAFGKLDIRKFRLESVKDGVR